MELHSVLVTGANRGIGLEFTRQLVNSGKPPQHVFATYRNEDTNQELDAIRDSASLETKVHLLKMDILVPSEVEEARKYIEETVGEKGLTLLINNAGVLKFTPIPNITAEMLHYHFNANAVGPILLVQTMLPLLKKAALSKTDPGMSFSKAAILNISAGAGSIANVGALGKLEFVVPAYKISKTALNMGMRVLAAALKDDNILIINMCPGWVKTDMGSEMAELLPQDSIAAMLETISTLNETHHGTFMDRFGKQINW